MSTCKFCDKPICARGLCRPHYMQAWFKGSHERFETKDHDLKQRLLAKVVVLPSGCWKFTGNKRHDKNFRYGMIWVDGKNARAHRVSYEIHKGPIPDGLDVLHSCDFPPCVNPDHLFAGNRGANNKDATKKGRNAKGRTHGHAVLTEREVLQIRASSETHSVLSKRFGVCQSAISRIRSRHLWKHI